MSVWLPFARAAMKWIAALTACVASVSAWTAAEAQVELDEPGPRVVTVYTRGGNYDPSRLMIRSGDRLQICNEDPIEYIPMIGYENRLHRPGVRLSRGECHTYWPLVAEDGIMVVRLSSEIQANAYAEIWVAARSPAGERSSLPACPTETSGFVQTQSDCACEHGGIVEGIGGDGKHYMASWDGMRRLTWTEYLLKKAPNPDFHNTMFYHFFLDGEPFPDAAWGITVSSARVTCQPAPQ